MPRVCAIQHCVFSPGDTLNVSKSPLKVAHERAQIDGSALGTCLVRPRSDLDQRGDPARRTARRRLRAPTATNVGRQSGTILLPIIDGVARRRAGVSTAPKKLGVAPRKIARASIPADHAFPRLLYPGRARIIILSEGRDLSSQGFC